MRKTKGFISRKLTAGGIAAVMALSSLTVLPGVVSAGTTGNAQITLTDFVDGSRVQNITAINGMVTTGRNRYDRQCSFYSKTGQR